MITPTELKAIRERCEKATQGPWEAHIQTGPYRTRNYAGKVKAPVPIGEHSSFRVHLNLLYEGDVHFIAHARTDIPRLLDEVERLRKALDRAAVMDTIDNLFNRIEAAERVVEAATASYKECHDECNRRTTDGEGKCSCGVFDLIESIAYFNQLKEGGGGE